MTLDYNDLEFVHLLHGLGVNRNVAKVITYLGAAGESTSREIERGCNMRQPEISIAMRTLRRKNWIRVWEVIGVGKCRPSNVLDCTPDSGQSFNQRYLRKPPFQNCSGDL